MEDKYTCEDCTYDKDKKCTLPQSGWDIHGAKCIEDILTMERERFTG